jgi:transcriptional regulator with XRE-family HTH domain
VIGKRLIELRNKKKMTQKEVAAKLKISRSTYSNYESDFREPDFKNVEILADIFGVSVDYLLGREVKESSIEELKKSHTLETIDRAIFDEFMKLDPKKKDKLRRIMEIVKEE